MPRAPASATGRVALVGRPNVGKSTLFNRLTGGRRAIVTAVAGTTRDVLEGEVEWQGRRFSLIDTGGVVGASEDPMQEAVAARGRRAAGGVDLVIFVVAGPEGPVPADEEIAADLRTLGAPVLLAVNKMDDRRSEGHLAEFFRFGLEPLVEIAAEHGQGVGDLLDLVVAQLPLGSTDTLPGPEPDAPRIAVVGRPNVGKSSLVNRLLGQDRVMVSSTPGTTRDAIEDTLRWHRQQFRLVDTAGIRRPGRVARGGKVESVSVVRARHAMEEADVAVLVIDAAGGTGKRDAAIAGEAEKAGCGVVLAANKWDLVKGRGPEFVKEFDRKLRDVLKFVEYAPIVHLSALTGERAHKVLQLIDEVGQARRTRVTTAALNKVIEHSVAKQAPSGARKGTIRVRYAVQSGVAPPTFTLFTSRGERLHFSYERYLRNQLRTAFGFLGSPIRLKVRGRR